MCGQYSLNISSQQLSERFDAQIHEELTWREETVYPGETLPVVLPNHVLYPVQWGLKPYYSKQLIFNARLETVTEKPTFQKPFAQKRCLVPATSYYEFQSVADQTGKQRWSLSLPDDEVFAMAGICERYSDGQGGTYLTYAIITREASKEVAPIHHRMPLILPQAKWQSYLTFDGDSRKLQQALLQLTPPTLIMQQVERS